MAETLAEFVVRQRPAPSTADFRVGGNGGLVRLGWSVNTLLSPEGTTVKLASVWGWWLVLRCQVRPGRHTGGLEAVALPVLVSAWWLWVGCGLRIV